MNLVENILTKNIRNTLQVPAKDATEESNDDEDPATYYDHKCKPVETPVTGLEYSMIISFHTHISSCEFGPLPYFFFFGITSKNTPFIEDLKSESVNVSISVQEHLSFTI